MSPIAEARGVRRTRAALGGGVALALAALPGTAQPLVAQEAPLSDEPVVWFADDRRDVPQPAPRDIHIAVSAIREILLRPIARGTNPVRLIREATSSSAGIEAANVNRLDEVPTSAWFTNRIGLLGMTPEEAARGPGDGRGPDTSAPWKVVRAKTEGVTPGFTIEDAAGDRYLVKFDPPGHLGLATAAGVIGGRILHAAGFNVPDDNVVHFTRDQLVMGDEVRFESRGQERTMTPADLTRILDRVERTPDGRWRALASKIVDGRILGPFSWQGTREDDPNDRLAHEHRRELRAFFVFASWICHFDTKQQNTLDSYVEVDGRHFVRHYFIDLASTLGAGGRGPERKHCHEYTVDGGAMLSRLFTLGFNDFSWAEVERPEGLDGVGYFDAEHYEPKDFVPYQGNKAYANMTDRDGYWAAKIIAAFTDEHVDAIVAAGRYPQEAEARYMSRTLKERRDKLVRYWFLRVAPLDFFRPEGTRLLFSDLGIEAGIFPEGETRYRYRVAAVNSRREARSWSEWSTSGRSWIPIPEEPLATDRSPYVAVELQVTRGSEWQDPVRVYLTGDWSRVLEVQR